MTIHASLASHYAEVRRRLYGHPVREVMVPRAVAPPMPSRKGRIMPLSPGEIIRRVAKWYGVTPDDIVGNSRTRRIVEARQCAVYWVHTRMNLSAGAVGRRFNRDHATILHSIKAHVARRKARRS